MFDLFVVKIKNCFKRAWNNYFPGYINIIDLFLRRTLVLQQVYSTFMIQMKHSRLCRWYTR